MIVLDAVGAGALPDAAEYGDEGSDTLGNVARAVGGLDLPNLEALGLGNVEPLEGCPPQPGAPAVAGRLLERSKGKDTTTGHWELMGVVTAVAFPTYPHGLPDEVIDPFMNRTGRGVLGNKAASGTEIIQELGEEHQRTGKWIVYTSADSVFQIAAHEETIPLEELYEGCRAAREILDGRHAVGRVIARPFTGSPGHYERTPNRHDFSLEPRRPNYLSAMREAGNTVYGVGKIHDIFAGCDIDESFPTQSNVEGINRTIELLENMEPGSCSSTSSRRTCSGGTATTRSTSTAACRTSTGGCPTSSKPCARATCSCSRRTTAATRRRPRRTTPASTRCCSRTRRAGMRRAGCTRRASSPTSGATVGAWLGAKHPGRGVPGTPILEP